MVECGDIGEAMARTWAIRRAGKRHGATLEEDAASTLIERCGDDLGRIDSELGKLAAMAVSEAGPGGTVTITGAMVNEVVGRSREESAWDWQSTLIMGHTEGAIERQRYLVNVMRESPVLLWWACMDLTRKLHAASNALKAGENERNIATALRLWGPAQGALLAKARELGPAGARRALKLAVEADAGVKSGLGDAERTLEVVAVRLTAMLRPRAAR
jgi:DNA polymerase III delta subunit